jgi:CheY-like chemotaxis protein
LISDEDPTVWHPDGAKMELLPSTTQGGDSAAPLADLAGLRILLAEDGADNQRLLSYLLRRAGAEVSVADNGRIAVDHVLAAGDAVDVIFMDMQMPELDGYQATKELRAGGYTGPIVALTANAMSTDRNRCLAAGCNDYMTKPVDRRALLGTCARWASRSTV